jgi:hypothetical protein
MGMYLQPLDVIFVALIQKGREGRREGGRRSEKIFVNVFLQDYQHADYQHADPGNFLYCRMLAV